jgi:predicted TIM-barrel fold metal-dependent hydrolase
MSAYDGPYFDVDVHHRLPKDADILAYLPKEWHGHALGDGRSPVQVAPPAPVAGLLFGDTKRDDAVSDDGIRAGGDYDTVRKQLLDPHSSSYRAVLTHQLGEFGGHANQYYSRALARAMNDWTIEEWLAKDDRLYAAIVIPLAEPEEAVKEIRRVGAHPQMLGVLLVGNVLGRPLGDPLFEPIYVACAEMGLHVLVHISLVSRPNLGSVAAGGRLTFLQALSQSSQQAMHYVSSLIVHGVFERHPNLVFLFQEYGIGWLPYAMSRLDQTYSLLKAESPWVKRLPSEYVRQGVKLSTQPLEENFDDRDALFDLMGTVDGVEDMLLFSTDYPHGTMDEPHYVARRLPAAWREKVLYRNACDLFGLPVELAVPSPAIG